MLYFLAIFCSPLALLVALRPISALLNSVLYILAWLGLLFFVVPGVVFWFLGVLHAYFVIASAKNDRLAKRILKSQGS